MGKAVQLDRQRSGKECTTNATRTPLGCTSKRKRRQKEDKNKESRQPRHDSRGGMHSKLPFSSVLVSTQGLGRATDAMSVALEFDWVQQAVGTVNNVKHLLAGGLSAILSKTATAPLERIKMEMQLKQKNNTLVVATKLFKEGGFLTFWRGNGMNLLRVTPHKAVNFYSFYLYRKMLGLALGAVDVKSIDRFAAGAMAGSTATLMCFPLDVIRTRMLSRGGDRYRTAIGTVKTILQEESFASLYVGCLPAVVSTAASGAIFYGVYDLLKERFIRLQRARNPNSEGEVRLGAGRTMLYGALAGAAAESILYPLEVLRRRMQLQGMQATEVMVNARQVERMTLAAATEQGIFSEMGAGSNMHRFAAAALRKNYLSKLMNAVVEIYKTDGLPGFYQGITPHILQVLPSAALSYYFYEACKRALQIPYVKEEERRPAIAAMCKWMYKLDQIQRFVEQLHQTGV